MLDHTNGIAARSGVRRQLVELQEQAFAQVAGADPYRFELLHACQHRLHLMRRNVRLGECAREGFGDFLDIDLQHPVGVDGFNDGGADEPVPRCHRRKIQLP